MFEKIQYITQGNTENEILEEVSSALYFGIKWIQLRIKNSDIDFLGVAKKIKNISQGKAVFIVNDNVDIALSVEADGVHLGLNDMPIKEARHILGHDKIIGGTANTLSDCMDRVQSGVDYIGLGPYQYTTTKEKLGPLLGIQGYKEILKKNKIPLPVYAVGGIGLEDIKILKRQTNIWGIAVSSLLKNSENKSLMLSQIKNILYDR